MRKPAVLTAIAATMGAAALSAAAVLLACTGDDPTLSEQRDGGSDQAAPTQETGSPPAEASVDGGDAADAGDPLACNPSAPFSTFTNLAELNSADEESTLSMSADELHVVFVSSRGGGGSKFFSASRNSNPGAFGAVQPETFDFGNGVAMQSALAADGLTLHVATGAGGALLKLTRQDATLPFSNGTTIATPSAMSNALPVGAFRTAVDTLLVTGTNQAGGSGERSLWEWSPAGFTSAQLVLQAETATTALTDPVLSKDGSTLFYARVDSTVGGSSRAIWQTSRLALKSPFQSPGALVPQLSGKDVAPHFLSDDGCRLYFSTTDRPNGKGGRDFWLASRGK